jgi:pyridoxamine 5'-phosphate oxidase
MTRRIMPRDVAAIPPIYNDLDAMDAHAWTLLARGANEARSLLHTPVLASIGLDGAPQARTVVLRAVDRAARQLRIHTDRRSPKFAELQHDPRVTLLAYDAAETLQVRLRGAASLHTGDALAHAAWVASAPSSRACYAQTEPPGSAIDCPGIAPPVPASESQAGYENFAVVLLSVTAIETLYLA